MTAKMIVVTASVFLNIGLLGGIDNQSSSTSEDAKLEPRVVRLSPAKWASIQNQVNTNGWSYIKDQNVLLVLTNGCPGVEHLLPMIPPQPEIDLERNPLKVEGKRGEDGKEPMPYQDQGL